MKIINFFLSFINKKIFHYLFNHEKKIFFFLSFGLLLLSSIFIHENIESVYFLYISTIIIILKKNKQVKKKKEIFLEECYCFVLFLI